MEDARERALSKAGERRYLYGKRKMTKTTETVRDKDVMHAGKDMGIKAFENKTAPDAAVEVLDPLKVKLKATVTVLVSAKKAMDRQLCSLKDYAALAKEKNNDGMVAEREKAISTLEPFLDSLRVEAAKYEAATEATEELQKQCEVHQDCSSHVLKRPATCEIPIARRKSCEISDARRKSCEHMDPQSCQQFSPEKKLRSCRCRAARRLAWPFACSCARSRSSLGSRPCAWEGLRFGV